MRTDTHAAAAAAARATILVVDDNPASRYATSRVLRGAGFEVLDADTGNKAMTLAASADLVVLDVNLPDFDGFEVCRRIRTAGDTARTPVIHLSATFVKDVDKIQGLQAGADGYLTHPVEPPVLVATINAFLRTRQAEEAMRKSEAKFRSIFDRALNGILLISGDGIYLEANPAMCEMLKRKREEIVGKHGSAFIPAGQQAILDEVERELNASGQWRGMCPLIRGDGERVELEWSISMHAVPGVRLAIISDVTDRRQIEADRERLLSSERAARAEAERANRTKDEFLATLSHELRTPLNAIVGWAQILKSGKGLDRTDLEEGIDAIERNAQVQAQLIADLLDIARITAGKIRLDVQSVDLVSVVNAALESTMPATRAKEISVHRTLDPAAAAITGDPARLQQVVWNLVSNAVKFTPKGGRIEVKLQRVDQHALLTVSDNGAGISPEFLPYLFERFRQEDSAIRSNMGGLGLGLAIVKNIIEMHGGTVAAASEGENLGASFHVRLPLATAQPTAKGSGGSRTSHRSASEEIGWRRDPSRGHDWASTSLAGVRVMVVEDDADARNMMRRILGNYQAEVFDAGDVATALGAVDGFKPHLLISDIGMPDQDGYHLIRTLRARGVGVRDLPAIALTAFARTEDRRQALLAGFQLHLVKPVDPSELLAAIAGLIGRAGET